MKIDIQSESPEGKIIARAVDVWGFKSPTAFVMYAIKEGYKARVAEELQKAGGAPLDRNGIEELQGVLTDETLGSVGAKARSGA